MPRPLGGDEGRDKRDKFRVVQITYDPRFPNGATQHSES